LEQNPGGLPFFVFVDLNLPLTPGIPTEQKPWFKDLKEIFDRIEAGSPGQKDNFLYGGPNVPVFITTPGK
jgi:hypothetical protein